MLAPLAQLSSAFRVLAAGAIVLAMGAVGYAQDGGAKQKQEGEEKGNSPTRMFIYLSDVNGVYGMEAFPDTAPPLPGQKVTFWVYEGDGIYSDPINYATVRGVDFLDSRVTFNTPFFFEFYSDVTGPIAGLWAGNVGYLNSLSFPSWTIPVDGEEVGMTFEGISTTGVYKDKTVLFNIVPRIADRLSEPSMTAIYREVPTHSDLSIDIVIKYLEGNDLHGSEDTELHTRLGVNQAGVAIVWGPENIPSGSFYLGHELPLGPVSLSVAVEDHGVFVYKNIISVNNLYNVSYTASPDSSQNMKPSEVPLLGEVAIPPKPWPVSPNAKFFTPLAFYTDLHGVLIE
ncbi:MAG: hypothetical protein RLY93_19600 [Sumerlaeia bacterium]